jgi:hypothetical protein
MKRCFLISAATVALATMSGWTVAKSAYENFRVAIYVTVDATHRLEDPKVLEEEYRRIAGQVRFDKVYLETYRSGQFADDAALEPLKKFFTQHGIAVSGGIAFSAPGQGGQFGTLDYESEHDREVCRQAVELAARHFDEIILDDFFFYSTKSDADIAAKADRSWTQYRLRKMREVAQDLVLKTARAVNPHVRVIIKYPNWYEHYQALGYDLDIEAKRFDAIYTGTETRDPEITDQHLQQYQSYLIFRYLDNVRPGGGDRGGWVDTYGTRYVDRYAEQLWDTLFAKAPEITLFNWSDLASRQPLRPGDRSWSGEATSFNWDAMLRSGVGSAQEGPPGWASAAGFALAQADRFLGRLGRPIGIASYKPYQSSSGEDFLQDYLGNIGIPIELTPQFPTEAPLVLLTESAQQDPDIVAKIKRQLSSGRSVVITSGLLHALQGRGIEDIAEIADTGRSIGVQRFFGAFGAGRGANLAAPGTQVRSVNFPEIRYYTNDAWPLIRGVAQAYGVPILLMDRYSRGVLYVLDIPDNPGDLYELPQPVLSAIRAYLQPDFPVRLDAPALVSLFAYDNGTFIVQSFRDETASVGVSVAGVRTNLADLVTGERVVAEPSTVPGRRAGTNQVARTTFLIQVPPHSYRVFSVR